MPLPPALASRLAKRGLINEEDIQGSVAEEEVFAEDYDDVKTPQKRGPVPFPTEGLKSFQDEVHRRMKGHPGCPNKYNIYHECTTYCVEKYGKGHEAPDPRYISRKNALLFKYPLPEDWKEIFDPGTGRFYFWNTETDLVSWLPPGHPKHAPTEAASVLREDIKLAESDDDDASGSEDDKSDDDFVPPIERKPQLISQNFSKGRNKKRENDLDPMDPASYSDIPRGTWSSGLLSDTKTGVDSTASGPLYQQRPLPSPGAVLRANKRKK